MDVYMYVLYFIVILSSQRFVQYVKYLTSARLTESIRRRLWTKRAAS